ncbi:MAG: Type 1 glutamine amidotransferase-like domain-containing protein [Opitutaceae bacterium]
MRNLRLYLFSDHRIAANRPLDEMVLTAAGTRAPSVVWIPAGSQPERTLEFFEARKHYYSELGVTNVTMLRLDEAISAQLVSDMVNCDIVHLSGGDPFVFLPNLRATGIFEVVRDRAVQGGVTVGDSAGAMLMGPNIEIAKFGHIPVPDHLFDLSALGLVDFEFHAHLGTYGASVDALRAYSHSRSTTVYGAPDGSGVAIEGPRIVLHGPVVVFQNGETTLNHS